MITDNPEFLEKKAKEDIVKWWGKPLDDESFPFHFSFIYHPTEVPLSEIYSDDSSLWKQWGLVKVWAKLKNKIPMLIIYNCEGPVVFFCFTYNDEIATVAGEHFPKFVAYSLVMKGMPNLCSVFLLYDLLALDKKLFEGLKPHERE